MLSPSDTILIFVIALLLFGPEHLPKIARQLGDAMRHVQNTTNSFMAEMDRAAAAADLKAHPTWNPPPAGGWETPGALAETTVEEHDAALPGTTLRAEDAPELPDPAVEHGPPS